MNQYFFSLTNANSQCTNAVFTLQATGSKSFSMEVFDMKHQTDAQHLLLGDWRDMQQIKLGRI